MDSKEINEIIEIAKQESKEDFLRFVKGIYDVDENMFDHIWKVPVIEKNNGKSIIETELSTKTKDELSDIIEGVIKHELGKSDGCLISFSRFESEFTKEEINEWREKVDNEEVKSDYNAIIIYDEQKLRKIYTEFLEEKSVNELKVTKEKIKKAFIKCVKDLINHERCHLNANCMTEQMKSDGSTELEEINGVEASLIDIDNLLSKREFNMEGNNENRNEVFVDTLNKMMANYQEGDTIEDCLYKVIRNRNGQSQYDKIKDKNVLIMYSLFPNELTYGATFGAYELSRDNVLQRKLAKIFGERGIPQKQSEFDKMVEKYIMKLDEDALSDKQKEMLKMLGISTDKKLVKNETRDVAMTRKAMGALAGSLLDVNAMLEKYEKEGGKKDGPRDS